MKEILAHALELGPSQRASYLDCACAVDPWLRAELDRLLAAEQGAGTGLLGDTVTKQTVESFSAGLPDRKIGHRIGPYRIVEPIGEGGMGMVYRAVRADDQYQKQVAIKLVQAGPNSGFIVGRFKNERQILASLEHPNIARLLDGGTTDEGTPYFVMELIAGLPIDDYCDQHRLSIIERLRLFLQVCAAVQFAHEHLIIHRDIKPGNILVCPDGVAKLLDFGIAKILEPGIDDFKQDATMTLFPALTPAYASPEQVEGRAITTASDVYSLGVVLYELLTGSRPVKLRNGPLDEILRQLRVEEPLAPSSKVIAQAEIGARVAEKRSTSARQLANLLRGDLDCIVMKALDKEPSRRYAIAAAVAADIGRYLNHEAVMARPSSLGYRIRKYVVRHRLGVAAVSTVVALLIAFGIIEFLQVKRITQERDRADRITQFMTGMFKVSDPSESKGNTITAREILDKASTEIETGLAKEPVVQAELMYAMAKTYEGLGLYGRAQALCERALGIQRVKLGSTNQKTLRTLTELGWLLQQEGHSAEAEKLIRQTLDAQRRALGPDYPDTLLSMAHLGWVLREEGHYSEAENVEQETLGLQRRVLGPEDTDTVITLGNLGTILQDEGQYEEAEKLQNQVVEIDKRVLGGEHPFTLMAMEDLAITEYKETHYGDAEKMEENLLEVERRVLGPGHPSTLKTMANLFNTLDDAGKHTEAEILGRETLDLEKRVLGPQHPLTLGMEINLSEVLVNERRFEEAQKLQREALHDCEHVLGPEHPYTLAVMNNLANSLDRDGNYAEAEELQRKTLEVKQRVLGKEQPDTLESMVSLAKTLTNKGDYAEAEKLLGEALEVRRRVIGADHPETLNTMELLASAYAREKQYPRAEVLFREAVERAAKLPEQTPLSKAWYEYARGAAFAGRPGDSIRCLGEAIHNGYKDRDSLVDDKAFQGLRGSREFQRLIAELTKGPLSKSGEKELQ